jgi:uncharacterized protein (TIGR02147 family)
LSTAKSNPNGIQFRQLSVDSFNVMADWYHDAILELFKSADFEGSEKYISKRIGISLAQTRAAIHRLSRLGLINIDKESHWTTHCKNSLVNFDDTSQSNHALKEYQKQLLDLSKKAVDEVPVENRNHTSFVVAIDPNLIEEINMPDYNFPVQRFSIITS